MKPSTFSIFKSIGLALFLMLFLTNLSFAQDASLRIVDLDEFLQEEEIGPEHRIAKMIREQLPTIIFSGGQEFFPTDQLPQVVHVNASDIGKINTGDARFRTVKMLNIYISSNAEKSSIRLNESLFSAFMNLEFVFINAAVDLSQSEVASMVSGLVNTELTILFKSEIPQ